jgi:two-component system response regulator PilR (NtrC family)
MQGDTILVVEDEPDLAVAYERLLARWGYRVVVADSRQAGLAALGAHAVQLVIADLRLPDGDGMDVVRAAGALASPPPVLVAAASISPARRRAVNAAGAAAVLLKPFDCETLRSLVAELLVREEPADSTARRA